MKTLLLNGTLVCGGRCEKADILIEDETIARIAPRIGETAGRVIDAAGCYVFPGFIDTHTHLDLDLGVTKTADDFASGTRAALMGGTTTVLDFATQDRGMSMGAALDVWHQKAAGSSCHYGFHMAVSEWNDALAGEIDEVLARGVSSFKMYMVYDALRVDDGQLYDALRRFRSRDCILGVHCENYDVLQRRIRELHGEGVFAPYGHALARPAAVEAEGVARLMRIAELAEAPVWVVHLSSGEGLEEACRARARGQEVYLETCPQYLVLDDARYRDPDAAKFVMSPPLRKPADSEALLGALGSGEVDVIGTDHCSFTMAQKGLGQDDFAKIPNGCAGVQNRAQLVYSYAAETGRITLAQMAALLSENAARLFGMYPKKGTLTEGSDADITVYDPRGDSAISYRSNLHHCDNSPYEGLAVRGHVRDVLLMGEPVVSGGQLVREGMGRFVPRGKSLRPRR